MSSLGWGGIGLAILLALFAAAYGRGYWNGRAAALHSVEIKTIVQTREIVRRKNEIRNNRLEPAAVVAQLRAGTF